MLKAGRTTRAGTADVFVSGGGELGALIRGFDWKSTPLGPIESWSQGLLLATRIMLTSRQPIWIGWGPELTYLYNDPYKAIIGGKHPQALGQPTHVVWSEIWDVISPMLETALAGEEGTYVESQQLIMERHGYREETYYTFSYSPIPDDDGTVGGIICANTDDTQRRIGERQLALLNELAGRTADARTWREVCEQSGEALTVNPYDLPFANIYIAQGEEAVLAGSAGAGVDGYAPPPVVEISATRLGDAVGQRELVVIDVSDRDDFPRGAWPERPREAALVPIAATGQTAPGGVLAVGLNPFRKLDDDYRSFLSLVAGQISASIASATAYEEERSRAEALAELDRAKTTFFTNVSHEFRTPLTLMLGPVEDLLARPPEERDAGTEIETLEVVRRNAVRLLRMVNTVLDFSRLGSTAAPGSFRPVDLAALTTEIAESFRDLFTRAGVRLVVECERLSEPAYVVPDAWEKIVLNLLSNAFKFTLEGEVRVGLAERDGQIRLTVSDSGTGIPEDELPHLFERFHRVVNEAARTQEGTGIGLALVRELVETHGGSIAAESVLGRGTTFTVTLPSGHEHLPAELRDDEPFVVESAALAAAFTEEASRWIGVGADDLPDGGRAEADGAADAGDGTEPGLRRRVAVVDDNADMREYIARVLAREWEVETHPDGRAALDAILRAPPDLVVTDVMMPRLDGFGLLAALRANAGTRTIPVIVVSARAGEESSIEGLAAGADDYLVKPFSARELVARVRVNMELARLREETARFEALEDVRSHVITTVSHELRTPVSAIYGVARTLRRVEQLEPQALDQLLGVLDSEAGRLARITSDILTTERATSGVLDMKAAAVDLREVVTAAVSAASVDAAQRDRIACTVPSDPVSASIDANRIQQVITNLLDNAVKYSDPGVPIDVLLERRDGVARIVVADEGFGIPADARERIFERFFRVDPELNDGIGGTGLGLYISREIVRASGGTIHVEENEPRGSRFVVTLPVSEL